MGRALLVGALVVIFTLSITHGLKCHEGFNMTLNGIPMYFWSERTCTGNSKCIGQEMAIDTALTGKVLRTAVRYGACMSSSYADYLDCDKLFGKDSDFDPAKLLDLIPGIETSINKAVQDFTQNTAASLKQLLSSGNGIESFVDGIFKFYENLGFNLTKAVPLKPSLVKLLTALIDGDTISTAFGEFMNEFAQLDTQNPGFAAALRSFLTNIGVDLSQLDTQSPFITTLIEKLPGLVRSIFPSGWQPGLWYDVFFKLLGNINPADWTKSTEDMVATIKSSYEIPDDITQYVNPILDAFPDLARGLQIDPAYTGNWSLELLKTFSEEDSSTQAFSTAFIVFLEKMNMSPLQYEFKATIQWMPGLFYKFFPGDKTVIQRVYMKMADGFNSFNFSHMGSTAPETKLSMMIKNLVTIFTGPQPFNTSAPAGAVTNALVVNFAKMFYDLMNVEVDYTNYIDTFATVIDDEMKKWPGINVGSMIGKLITQLGGGIPAELEPMLGPMQNILTAIMEVPFNGTKLVNAFYSVTASYKSDYPDSPFPDLVDRYIDLMFQLLAIDYSVDTGAAVAKANQLSFQLQYWNIDMQFAIIKAYNFSADELYQMLVKAFPDYDLYIRAMKAMNPEDVKQLMKDLIAYFSTTSPQSPFTTQGLVGAMKPAFQKITKSINTLMSEIRRSFAPNLCKFTSCMEDLCNGQQKISSALEYTKTLPTVSTTTVSTTSDGNNVSFNVVLNVATFWMAAKMFL